MERHTLRRTGAFIASAGLLASLTLVTGASAAGPHYTRGDAEMMLGTYPATDQAFDRPGNSEGLDIRPFDYYGSLLYCVDDWHVLALAWFDWEYEVPALPFVWTRKDANSFLTGLTMEFRLDEQLVHTTSGPVQPHNYDSQGEANFEQLAEDFFGEDVVVGKGWGVQHGRILAPGDLAVGVHELAVDVQTGFGPVSLAVEFTVTDC